MHNLLKLSLSLLTATALAPLAQGAPPAVVPPAVTSLTLLNRQSTTVLEQAIRYPGPGPARISSAIITLAPGQSTGWHFHETPMYAYLLEGQLEVAYAGGVKKALAAGQALLEAIGTHHSGTNPGPGPVRILVVSMGADGLADTVKLP